MAIVSGDLGKASLTVNGPHDSTIAYEKLCVVSANGISYVSKKAVPAGILLANTEYWMPMTDDAAAAAAAAAAAVVAENAISYIAEDFDTETDYSVDSYCFHDGKLYRFTTDHSAGAWDGDDAEEVTITSEIVDFRQEIVTPEQFGAKGDGVTDDTQAINLALQYGHLVFPKEKTYVADIVTPKDKFCYIDLNGSTILGSITVQRNDAVNYNGVSRTTIKNGNIKNSDGDQAILIKDYAMRTVIQNMSVYTKTDGIVCGESGTFPSDCYIDNCFINVTPGFEDTSGTGVKCVNTDNKIMNCRIYGFKTCIQVGSIDIISNVHFLYRGDFSTNWNQAVAIKASGYPIINKCYFDTYKIGIMLTGTCYPQMTDCVFYSWREDTGAITGFIRIGNNTCRLFIKGFYAFGTAATEFNTVEVTAQQNENLYTNSVISHIFATHWSKIPQGDILRQDFLLYSPSSWSWTSAVSSNQYTSYYKYGHLFFFNSRITISASAGSDSNLATGLPLPKTLMNYVGYNQTKKLPHRLIVDNDGNLKLGYDEVAEGDTIIAQIVYPTKF